MQKELEILKKDVTDRIHKLFLKKFEGNKLQFSIAVGCDEKTIRLLFDENQGMTLNLLFKIAAALETTPSNLLDGLELKKNIHTKTK